MIANPQSIHRYSVRTYYEDTDAGGVVYHANYLRYAERARTEVLRDAGIPHADLVERFGRMFMVHRAEIDYVRPAMLDDLLVVETETMEVGGATVLLRQTVSGPKGICATLRIRLACIQIGRHKPARIPPEWREALIDMRRRDGAGAPAHDDARKDAGPARDDARSDMGPSRDDARNDMGPARDDARIDAGIDTQRRD
jgi:acyl-CoA thioester hydrolase